MISQTFIWWKRFLLLSLSLTYALFDASGMIANESLQNRRLSTTDPCFFPNVSIGEEISWWLAKTEMIESFMSLLLTADSTQWDMTSLKRIRPHGLLRLYLWLFYWTFFLYQSTNQQLEYQYFVTKVRLKIHVSIDRILWKVQLKTMLLFRMIGALKKTTRILEKRASDLSTDVSAVKVLARNTDIWWVDEYLAVSKRSSEIPKTTDKRPTGMNSVAVILSLVFCSCHTHETIR